MFQSYLITAVRSMLRNKTSSLISIGGLALGMCCALLIFLYIQFELSFDTFHKKQDLIYRVLVKGEKQNGETEYRTSIAYGLADKLIDDSVHRDPYPETVAKKPEHQENRIRKSSHLEKYFPRLNRIPDLPGSHYITDVVRMSPQRGTVRYKKRVFEEDFFYFTEPAVFRMFDFPLQKGLIDTALSEPGSIVLTPEMAEKYFASEDPLGKIIHLDLPAASPLSFKITGILKPIPKNSSIVIDFLATLPFEDLQGRLPQWQPLYTYTYIEFGGVKSRRSPLILQNIFQDILTQDKPAHVTLVANDFDKELAKIRIPDVFADHFYTEWHFALEPLQYAYFAKDRIFTSFTDNHARTLKTGNQLSLQMLFLLALLLLCNSCINVVNLSTARSAGRAKEIAMRKVLGADRGKLIFQFLTESILLSFISLLFALSLVELLLPSFNLMLNLELATDYTNNWGYIFAMAGVTFATGVFSGIYPAFFLSSFSVMGTLKGETLPASKKLRKGLIILQITCSVCILISSLFLSQESSFLLQTDLGFHEKDIIFFKIDHIDLEQKYFKFKQDLLSIEGVSNVTSSSLVAWEYGVTGLSSLVSPDIRQNDGKKTQVRLLLTDHDFLKIYKVPIVNGAGFHETHNDFSTMCVLNQTARKLFDSENIVGTTIELGDGSFRQVIGVAKDFHYVYPSQKVEPLVTIVADEYYGLKRPYISVRLLAGHSAQSIKMIERTVKDFFPESIFSYRYLDKEIDRIHLKMNYHWDMILKFASGVACFLAALGLAGFAKYEAERKIKEIGIRKALGATRGQICFAFVHELLPMILMASAVACVLSYLLIPKLLQEFDYPWTYHLGLPVFMYSCSLTILISFLVVSYQIFRTASIDPADALRDE